MTAHVLLFASERGALLISSIGIVQLSLQQAHLARLPYEKGQSNSKADNYCGAIMVANPSYQPLAADPSGYKSFNSFYPYYLGEHANTICRRLHLVGTAVSSLVLLRVLIGKASTSPELQLHAPVWQYIAGGIGQGYFLAWVGHYFFEHNKPATFKYPLYSFQGDLRMLFEVVTLQRSA